MKVLTPLVLTAALGGIASAQQATFTMVPGAYALMDVTPDGTIVVGNMDSGDAFFWRWQQDPAPTTIGPAWAVAISDDGTAIAGMIDHPTTGQQVAARWTQGAGWMTLHPGTLADCGSISSASDISGDGKSVVGLGWEIGCDGVGFLWTEAAGFTQGLESLGNGHNRASAISRDGSAIGGFAQGDFSRTPAVWDPALPLATSGTVFDMATLGEVHGFSDDGSVAMGEWLSGPTNLAFYWPGWQSDPAGANRVLLGTLNPTWNGHAVGMAEIPPGDSVPPIIVGYDSLSLGKEAWIWTQSSGIVGLQSLLTSLGVAGVSALGQCKAVSSDGRVVVGRTDFGGGWIVTFPTPGQVSVYGCGGNPAGSMTVVSGLPEIGKTLTLGLDNPLGSQAPGALPFVVLATAPAFGFPCGTSLPGFGMGGGSGELLIDILTPPNPILPAIPGSPWTGAGSPASVQLTFPQNPSYIGFTLYGQGVLLDFSPLASVPVGLTDAVEMEIGG